MTTSAFQPDDQIIVTLPDGSVFTGVLVAKDIDCIRVLPARNGRAIGSISFWLGMGNLNFLRQEEGRHFFQAKARPRVYPAEAFEAGIN